MSAPANLEFDFIESPPPDYNTIQIIHHLNTAPPPYDACVRSTCAQSSKFRWSSGFRDSYCIRIATIATTACGFLMLLSAVLLLALQQILPDRLALLGWCLFGSACAMLLLSTYLWRTVLSHSASQCLACCMDDDLDGSAISSTFSGSVTGVSSPSAHNVEGRDYANPPDETSGPPPYQANVLTGQTIAPCDRLPRLPIVTFSNRVQPTSLQLAACDARIITAQSTVHTGFPEFCFTLQ